MTDTDQLDLVAMQRRTLVVVVASQVLGGAGLAAGITVGALLAQQMLGGADSAGLPMALLTAGSALAAYAVGRHSQHAGRRHGLAAGFAVAALGSAGVVLAAVIDNVPLLVVSLFLYGAGSATNLQARYAGTDLAAPDKRGTAVSVALVSTTLGAIAGPNSVGLTGKLARQVGLPALTGPFLLAGVAFALAGLVLFLFLRPDPLLTAMRVRTIATEADVALPEPALVRGGVAVGATVMVATTVAMVAIMTMTPVHMRHHHRSLDEVGLVISLHVAGMFLPSLVTGRLVDRVGRVPMAIASAGTMLTAGVVACLAPGDSMPLLVLALVLLGMGWNFGLISGTALVVDSTDLSSRARVQGTVDVLIAMAGAGSGALSGVVLDAASYGVLALGAGLLALTLVPVVLWHRTNTASLFA